jgi:hypothetical protein
LEILYVSGIPFHDEPVHLADQFRDRLRDGIQNEKSVNPGIIGVQQLAAA